MEGEPGSGIICSNGAAAHLAKVGDIIIIATYTLLDDEDAHRHQPRIVLIDEGNRIKKTSGTEMAGPHEVHASSSSLRY
jgi:aspartate 1-decarboxylase